MKAFVFRRWQETEIYAWLRTHHPTFCNDFRSPLTRLMTEAGEGVETSAPEELSSLLEAERAVRRIACAIERLVHEENPLATGLGWESNPFAEILAHELRKLDYNSLAWALFYDLEAVPERVLDALT